MLIFWAYLCGPCIQDKGIMHIIKYPTVYVNMGNGRIAGPLKSVDTDTMFLKQKQFSKNKIINQIKILNMYIEQNND